MRPDVAPAGVRVLAAVVELEVDGERPTVRGVARRAGMAQGYTGRLLLELRRHGLLNATAGRSGAGTLRTAVAVVWRAER